MIPALTTPPPVPFNALRNSVDELIARAVEEIDSPRLQDAMRYALEGGKRVRPLVTMLMCGAAGGREVQALHAAAAVELLHTSSLVHDDIMDRSLLRRGRPTLHAAHDLPTAILAGDTLAALAFRLIQRQATQDPGTALGIFSSAFIALCEGQSLDITPAPEGGASSGRHMAMVEKKTAALVEAAARLGALVATSDDDLLRDAGRFGWNLGMAFQAQDDLLDAVGEERIMGKPRGVDARNGRQTYLTLASPASRRNLPGHPDALSATRSIVVRYTETACRFLDSLPPSRSQSLLRELATALSKRHS